MVISESDLLSIASDWTLESDEFKAAIGRALMALDDAKQTVEAQNDIDLSATLTTIANDLFEIADSDSE